MCLMANTDRTPQRVCCMCGCGIGIIILSFRSSTSFRMQDAMTLIDDWLMIGSSFPQFSLAYRSLNFHWLPSVSRLELASTVYSQVSGPFCSQVMQIHFQKCLTLLKMQREQGVPIATASACLTIKALFMSYSLKKRLFVFTAVAWLRFVSVFSRT